MISVVVISKDEPALADTLVAVGAALRDGHDDNEVVVVDASAGRLRPVQHAFPRVRWIDFTPPAGAGFTIPEQRNVGVKAASGDVVVFVDAGCVPAPGWLPALLAPLADDEESIVAGVASGGDGLYDSHVTARSSTAYLTEAPTINLAIRRHVFDAVGGFDEAFDYGSDLDFTWRAVDAGFRIRSCPDAVVSHDWGTTKRQLKRAYRYGRARVRLYRKHPHRLRTAWRTDPMVFAYPLFVAGLPLTLLMPAYPLLLLVPLWRARGHRPLLVLADHLTYGCGVLRELVRR